MEEQQNNQVYQQLDPQPPVVTQPTSPQPVVASPAVIQPVVQQPNGALQSQQQLQQAIPPQVQSQPIVAQLSQQPVDTPQQPTQAVDQPQVQEPAQDEYKYQSGNLQATEGYQKQDNDAEEPKHTGDSVSWSASEFVLHEKTSGWHLLVGIGSLVLAIIIYFLTKSIFGAVTIVIVGVIISIFGNLKPRVLDYLVSPEGITIGEKHYDYLLFRSFAVIDSLHPSLQLMPQKRFAVPITMYFAPDDGDRIVDVLGEYLPFEHQERDFVDKLSARLRF